jgi:energy-converting hydrogenase B subunit D
VNAVQMVAFVLVAAAGTAVALTRSPFRQAIVLSLYGLVLTVLFVTLQAPDVALSLATIGSAALPTIVLLSLVRIKERRG